jgi:osmoprotectant transport system ATP-binding protein
LEHASRGEVRIEGRPVAAHDPIALRRRTGYVQQDGGLLPHWTVGRNIELVPWLLGWDADRRRRRADELLALLGLPPERFRSLYPRELSGGQRQRVAVARALAADPAVVLLDEPFGALDALTRFDVQEAFLALRRALRKTMLLVTHDLGEAFRLADRIGVLRDGVLLQVGPPAEIRARPATEYVAELVAHATGVPA